MTSRLRGFPRCCDPMVKMRNGEEFVMAEVRGRARRRVRWAASFAVLALALLVAPVPYRRIGARARALVCRFRLDKERASGTANIDSSGDSACRASKNDSQPRA